MTEILKSLDTTEILVAGTGDKFLTITNNLCHTYVMLCYVMLCYVMLCYVMLCYVMLCYVMLCYVMLCYVMLCYTHLGHAHIRWASLVKRGQFVVPF